MMDRIALISDIHSNIVALKAVMNDIENRGIHKEELSFDIEKRSKK